MIIKQKKMENGLRYINGESYIDDSTFSVHERIVTISESMGTVYQGDWIVIAPYLNKKEALKLISQDK